MSKEKLLPISIFTLAISILISSIFISEAIKNNGYNISSGLFQGGNSINGAINYQKEEKSNLNFQEVAVYLGISESELMTLVNREGSKIPHIKVEDNIFLIKKA